MLGTLLAINLFSRRLSGKIQIFLCATAASGLSVLSIAGIYQWLKTSEIVNTATFIPPLKGSFAVLLLFVGFDLLIFTQNKFSDHASSLRRHLIIGLIIAGTVFCTWGIASQLNVPAARLAKTTIPHIIAAKSILGETGRIIMGLVVVSGSGAAVNTLLVAVGEMIADVSRQTYPPFFLQRVFNRPSTIVILLVLVTAAMMALGVAGTDALDTYIRGSLILWLFNYAAIHFTLLLPGAQQTPKTTMHLFWWRKVSNGAILMLMLTGSVILIATDDNIGLMVRYFIFIFIGVGVPAGLVSRVLSRRRRSYVVNGN
jgi:amino acid transporter